MVRPTIIDDFMIYLARFERDVIVRGLDEGLWGTTSHVAIRPGRLEREPVGKLLGSRLACDASLAVEYYGHVKKSIGFMSRAAEIEHFGVRTMVAPLVNFSTVRVEDVARLAPDLVAGFPAFKAEIVAARFGPG